MHAPFLLFLLVAMIALPISSAIAEVRAQERQSQPNDVPRTDKSADEVKLPDSNLPEPSLPAEPNLPPDPNTPTPDKLELSCGTSVCVKVMSIALNIGGKDRSCARDGVRSLKLSPGGQAVLTTSDGRQLAGVLVRILVSSPAGTMSFDRDEVRASYLDVLPLGARPSQSESPLLVQNLLLREAAVEKLKQANQAALVACAQEYEKPLADAKAKVDEARTNHKLNSDAVARVRRDLGQLEAQQNEDLRRRGYSGLNLEVKRVQAEYRRKVDAQEKAAAELKAAQEAQRAVLKRKTDEQRVLYRGLPDAIARVQAVAGKHAFIMQSGGELSEQTMQRTFAGVSGGNGVTSEKSPARRR